MNNNLKNAFTLVEILLVIVILSVIIGLAVPNFGKSVDSFELKKTSSDIVYLVRWAQSRAINQNVDYQLFFMDDYKKYRILKAEPNQGLGKENFVPVPVQMGRTFTIPKSIKLSIDINPLKIYHDGSLDKATIQLESSAGKYILSSKIQRGSLIILNEND